MKMIQYIILILVLIGVGIHIYSIFKPSFGKSEYNKKLEQENLQLKEEKKILLNSKDSLQIIINEVKYIIYRMKQKDSLTNQKIKEVAGKFDKLKGSELKNKIEEEYAKDTNNNTIIK